MTIRESTERCEAFAGREWGRCPGRFGYVCTAPEADCVVEHKRRWEGEPLPNPE